MIYLFFKLVITYLSIETVYFSTWRLGPKMCTSAKNYEPFPPKIETAILDVKSVKFKTTKTHEVENVC